MEHVEEKIHSYQVTSGADWVLLFLATEELLYMVSVLAFDPFMSQVHVPHPHDRHLQLAALLAPSAQTRLFLTDLLQL